MSHVPRVVPPPHRPRVVPPPKRPRLATPFDGTARPKPSCKPGLTSGQPSADRWTIRQWEDEGEDSRKFLWFNILRSCKKQQEEVEEIVEEVEEELAETNQSRNRSRRGGRRCRRRNKAFSKNWSYSDGKCKFVEVDIRDLRFSQLSCSPMSAPFLRLTAFETPGKRPIHLFSGA